MIALLLIPVLLPFCAPLLARPATRHLTPVAALWALTLTALALASCSVAALGALLLGGALRLPLVAGPAELIHPLQAAPNVVALPLAALSSGALAVSVWALIRSAGRQISAFRSATAQADAQPTAGDLCIIDSPRADAYALPGRPNRVVVTTGMLRSLRAPEREALLAHERAHLSGRHHYFLAAAELCAHCHPGLRPLRTAIQLSTERAADETAADKTGDRRLTAQAIGHAALATRASLTSRPTVTPAATSGPVPHRVAALLSAPVRRRHSIALASAALLLTACASLLGAGAGAISLHQNVEIAQGEASAP